MSKNVINDNPFKNEEVEEVETIIEETEIFPEVEETFEEEVEAPEIPGIYTVITNIKRSGKLYVKGDKISFPKINKEVKSLISEGIIE